MVHTKTPAQDNWQQNWHRITTRSGLVKLWRTLLLIISLLILIFIIFYSLRTTQALPEVPAQSNTHMVKPIFRGLSLGGQIYSVHADEAVQNKTNTHIINFINPRLTINPKNGATSNTIKADFGFYNRNTQSLILKQSVDIQTKDGYHCLTGQAIINVKEKYVEGASPIQCQGEAGIIRANAYEVLDNYQKFIFKDNVTGQLNAEKIDTALTP